MKHAVAIAIAVGFSVGGVIVSAQSTGKGPCTGGAFVGSTTPTYAYLPGDSRNCRATHAYQAKNDDNSGPSWPVVAWRRFTTNERHIAAPGTEFA